ncbi:MAG: hypothetical protein DSY91_03360, partial [Deltaproteobacteria bacterium]
MAGGMETWTCTAVVFLVYVSLILAGYFLKWIGLPKKAAIALFGCFLVAFFSVYTLIHPMLPANHVANFAGRKTWIVEGQVLPPLDPGLSRSQVTVRVRALLTHDQRRIPACGRLRVSVYGPYTRTVYVGDIIRLVSPISRARPPANPYGFNYRRFLALRGIYALARVHDFSQLVVLQGDRRGSWRGAINRLRQYLNRWITASIPAPYNALASAFLIGYRGQVSPAMRDIFIRCGASHLIAISGLHLGIVSILLFLFIRRLLTFFPKIFLYMDIHRITAILTVVCLLFYLVLTGERISTIRAFVMAAAFLAVLFFRRTSRLADILLLAAFVILLFQPQAVFFASFQLTFAAVAGILMGVSRREFGNPDEGEEKERGGLKKVAWWLGATLLITLLAMAVTFPIATYHFHRSSPMAILANLFGIPYVGFVLLPLGLISLALYPVSVTLATFMLKLDGFFIEGLVKVFRFLASFPYSRVDIYPPRWYEIILYYGVFVFTVFAFRARSSGSRKRNAALAGGFAGLLLISFFVPRFFVKPSVTVFSVKKGTYVVASRGNGHAVVICQGLGDSPLRDDSRWVLLPYLLHERIWAIDALVVGNNSPVNLRAAGDLVTFKRPSYLVGTRPILHSLRMVLPFETPRIGWTEIPWSLKHKGFKLECEGRSGRAGRARETGTVQVSFRGLRLIVLSSWARAEIARRDEGSLFLITGWVNSKVLRALSPGRAFRVIRYPVGIVRRRIKDTRGGLMDLRRDGAVILKKQGDTWQFTSFLTHRTGVVK